MESFTVMLRRHSNDTKPPARRAIKSFAGVQGAVFQKRPLVAEGPAAQGTYKKECKMKSKKFNRKLVLNKNTIADLSIIELKDIYGGADPPRSYPYTGCFACLTGTCKPDVGC